MSVSTLMIGSGAATAVERGELVHVLAFRSAGVKAV